MERARLTHKLAVIKEKKGDIAGAATIMQELQVETYGSMEKREKVHNFPNIDNKPCLEIHFTINFPHRLN